VEEAAEWLNLNKIMNPKILEIGSGSGCISISMARKFPEATVVAVDVCEKALSVAKNNAKSLGNVSFLASDLFTKLDPAKDGDFDMIAANPPYISTSEMRELEIDVTFEPALALDGGKDGLKVMSRLVKDAPRFLKKNGLLIVEIGYKQGLAVERLFANAGFEKIEVIKDFQGHDRIVKGEKCGSV
jgi:release factor glutamine methyltransferase